MGNYPLNEYINRVITYRHKYIPFFTTKVPNLLYKSDWRHKMKYGYARVSTTDQKLENQIESLKNSGAEIIYQEKSTGTTTERPEFNKLLNELKANDTLIVTRTQEGKAYAKKHDPHFKEGRPKTYTDEQIQFA